MANKSALIDASQVGPPDKSSEQRQQLSESPEVDLIKYSFKQINIDASDSTFSSSCLNETLSVFTLLASVGLECYMNLFETHNIELKDFLDISYIDLQLLGIHDSRHRNLIMELIHAFRFD